MENKKDIWRGTKYPGYSASWGGRSCGPQGKVLRESISNSGYKTVNICEKGRPKRRSVHRIVAETFIPNPNGLEQVNHIDGNKLNNCVKNLEWVSRSDNGKHAARRLGKNFGLKSRPVFNLNTGDKYATIGEAAEVTGVAYSSLWEALNKGTRSGGAYWVYDEPGIQDLNVLVKNVWRWFDAKGLNDPIVQFAKLNEESGEMAHELTRGRYDTPEMKDAIGDTFVTLIGMAHHLNLDISECLDMAYEEIKNRKGKVIDGSFVKDNQ